LHTHITIARLLKHTDFSVTQIEELVKIAQSNNQVGWIVGDPDVHQFYSGLLKQHNDKLAPDISNQLAEIVKKGEPNDADDGISF
jgi:hypothetical protein